MKHVLQKELKDFLQKQIIKTAAEQDLTQDQVSELLGIDTRSYAYLKAGTYMCSASTLIVYLARMCPDPLAFIESARQVISAAEEKIP